MRQRYEEYGPVPLVMIISVSALLSVQLSVFGAPAEISKSRQSSARQKATST